ncbi:MULTISPECIES: 50S ribosomal protein L3 N(5)-glutamine methyltransferase [Marinobacter]|uniref:Ribosomal protein uL3 glutamine methyltransferase n=1 Tax=Marinobacter salarius TaxID=1420917 RepID=A0A1W6K9N0_9GAMM|nr:MULTISPECIES: 50S ribosomal protein L3 N(5)-glutamine methyltransferase [Marinobacter]MBP56055.1 50S ribosomal protein L3 N(5)-glutamine methyltransferase [Marinobacter sp.]ARM84123.1 50S ribosomal protein L3 glutamine methyltransferase [Marinobacter salarius]AZR42889.1 ribosomal protein L3 N(5)-glutamine methyltransferase [Marinobacter salarius]KXJ47990.1 MAG: ribosomal protein L3 N(5)-glutamine methyltransferase [Marinobacter sp. Hex_13]MBS8232921.1 50S ribosomal protein L3 N(5)-glutamine
MSNPIDDLHTVRDYLRYVSSRFADSPLYFGHGTDNVWDESVQLVMRSLHLPLENNTLFLDARLTREERALILDRMQRRIDDRVPLAYLLGEAWFMGLPFHVDERVLVPRSPLGELIQGGLQPWLGNKPVGRILDLCTGSGCIGIAAASVFEDAEVDLADISTDALDVAAVNIDYHEVGDRVSTVRSDVFDGLEGRYDVILSNPPYVDADDIADMPAEYGHEPELGLAAGGDGLDIAHRILARAADYLNPGGLLIVEVGNSWVALQEAYPDMPFTWLEFENGGDGVFLLTAEDLH